MKLHTHEKLFTHVCSKIYIRAQQNLYTCVDKFTYVSKYSSCRKDWEK